MIAAWGRYPIYVARALKARGYSVHCLGVRGLADRKALSEICDFYCPVGIAHLGKIIRHMRRHKIHDVIALGKVHKSALFRPFGIIQLFPDFTTLRVFTAHFITRTKDCKDDTLMKCIIRLFEKFGFKFGVPTDYAPDLLVQGGILTQRKPSDIQWRDINYGMLVAKELGRFDIGQSVLVANGIIIALEALEGTDLCIQRAGELYQRGGLVLVKMAKPHQDMRFDVPTIGMNTMENFARAGGKVIALEAGKTIVVDLHDVIRFANQHGISIVALPSAE